MGDLEKILKNTGKGFITGTAAIVDPVGAIISNIDYNLNGVGPADPERNSQTLYNHFYETVYSDPNDSPDFSTGYLPRASGNFLGGVSVLGLGYALWTCINPVAALALPISAGIYSLVRSGSKLFKTCKQGEKINNQYQKGSFLDGFRFGWHTNTSFLANILQPMEANFTGRGYDSSRIRGSTATHAANGARRNISSMIGSLFGKVTGQVANVLTLGLFPLYKTIREGINSVQGIEPNKVYAPKYINNEP